MPLILHIETSTDVCSVGLSRDGQLLALRETGEKYQHATHLTSFIEACCQEADVPLPAIQAVAVSRGPGSFTALRIGTSVAKGICFAQKKPLLSVDTLQALAYGARAASDQPARICAMIDARRMDVYMACFDHALSPLGPARAVRIDEETLAQALSGSQRLILTGNGAAKSREVVRDDRIHVLPLSCSARFMPELAERAFKEEKWENLAYYEPFYLKPPHITKPKKRL